MSYCVDKYVAHLKNEGVIAYPTETLWGLGANAFSEKSVEKIYDIKGRPENMAVSIIIYSFKQLEQLANLNQNLFDFLLSAWPCPLTAVVPVRGNVLAPQVSQSGFVGVRFADHPFLINLLPNLDFPLTTTSANKTGQPSPTKIAELKWLEEFDDVLIVDGYDLTREGSLGSTVVKFSESETKVLRQGDLSFSDLEELCGESNLPIPTNS